MEFLGVTGAPPAGPWRRPTSEARNGGGWRGWPVLGAEDEAGLAGSGGRARKWRRQPWRGACGGRVTAAAGERGGGGFMEEENGC
jgi:hypothetical protein